MRFFNKLIFIIFTLLILNCKSSFASINVDLFGEFNVMLAYSANFDISNEPGYSINSAPYGIIGVAGDNILGVNVDADLGKDFHIGGKMSLSVGSGGDGAFVTSEEAYIYTDSRYMGKMILGLSNSFLEDVHITPIIGLGEDILNYNFMVRGSFDGYSGYGGFLDNGETHIKTVANYFQSSSLETNGPMVVFYSPLINKFQIGFTFSGGDNGCFGSLAGSETATYSIYGSAGDITLGCNAIELGSTYNNLFKVNDNLDINFRLLAAYKVNFTGSLIGSTDLTNILGFPLYNGGAPINYETNEANGAVINKLNAGFDLDFIYKKIHSINFGMGMIYNWLPTGSSGEKLGIYKEKQTGCGGVIRPCDPSYYIDPQSYNYVIDSSLTYTFNQRYFGGLYVGFNNYDYFSNLLVELTGGSYLMKGIKVSGSIFYNAVFDENYNIFQDDGHYGFGDGMGFVASFKIKF